MSKDLTLKLSRPILSANGKEEILEITRKKDDDISTEDILEMDLKITARGQLPVICSVFNCTEKQIKSMAIRDYQKCAIFTMSLINIDGYDLKTEKRRLDLKRPIWSEDGKKKISYITRKKDDEMSADDILDSEYTSKLKAQKSSICNLYNLTDEQVDSLHTSDYMYLVTVAGKYSD